MARQEFLDQGIDISQFEFIPQGPAAACEYEPPNGVPNCIDNPSRATNPFAKYQGAFTDNKHQMVLGQIPTRSQTQPEDVLPSYAPRYERNRSPINIPGLR